MKVKGISKVLENEKVSNFLNKEGTTEIGVVSLKIIGIIAFISILINFCFVTQFGVVLQQVIIFSLKVISGIISCILNVLKDLDKNYPGTLSLAGAILGGILGFWGAIRVFKKQAIANKNQAIKKLMHQLLYTYRFLNLTAIKITDDKKFENSLKNSSIYQGLAYDSKWREYISEIEDYEDTEKIVRWFFRLENKIPFSREDIFNQSKKLDLILEKYDFSKQLAIVKQELEKEKNTPQKDVA